jgi:hypothetical protein
MPTTWNPSDITAGVTLSGGNLIATQTSGVSRGVRAIDRVYTGKYYWEITLTANISNIVTGLCLGDTSLTFGLGGSHVHCGAAGGISLFGTSVSINIGAFSAGGILCIALDAAADLVWFRNGAAGNWNGNVANNPATGVGGLNIAALSSGPMGLYPFAGFGGGGGCVVTANFGASGFTGTVPSGFTGGFPSGTTLVLAGVVTQAGVEHWGPGDPVAQVTQTGLEVWGAISAVSRAALVTQLAVEQWASVPPPPVTASQTAVSVNTG